MKDRGNVGLPTDIVKVLKTQDENYIRTMRMANLKVGPFQTLDSKLHLTFARKLITLRDNSWKRLT